MLGLGEIYFKYKPQFCFSQSAEKAGTAASSAGRLSAPQASAAAGTNYSSQVSAGAVATGSQASAAAVKVVKVPGPQTGVGQKAPALCRMSEGKSVTCSLCSREVMCEDYTQHLSDYQVQEQCEQRGAKAMGAVGLLQHLAEFHLLSCPTDLPGVAAPTTPIAQEMTPVTQKHSGLPDVPAPVPAPPTAHETSPAPP